MSLSRLFLVEKQFYSMRINVNVSKIEGQGYKKKLMLIEYVSYKTINDERIEQEYCFIFLITIRLYYYT